MDAPPGGGRSTRRSASTAGVSAPPTAAPASAEVELPNLELPSSEEVAKEQLQPPAAAAPKAASKAKKGGKAAIAPAAAAMITAESRATATAAPSVGAAQALAAAVDKIPLAVAVDEIALAVAVDTAHPPPDSTPLTSANAVGRRVRVPAFCWPTYPCLEHGGLGWTGCIIALKRSKRSKAATVQVRFTEAADERGVPYADVELKLAVLKPF
jgi:hypothetical protein